MNYDKDEEPINEEGEIKVKLDFTPPTITKKDKVFAYDADSGRFVKATVIDVDFSSEVSEYKVKSGRKTFKTFRVRSDKKKFKRVKKK